MKISEQAKSGFFPGTTLFHQAVEINIIIIDISWSATNNYLRQIDYYKANLMPSLEIKSFPHPRAR